MTGYALRLAADGRLADPLVEDAPLQRLFGLLDREGEEARLVGGAVRNALIGQPVADRDVATTAEPQEVMRRAKAAGLRVVPTGLAHGTVTVMVDRVPFEVTTLRRDVETDGRHAVVRFSRDFAEDAERRDFTINALSVSPDGRVHDTVGGLADLAAARVRFIGDADRRIVEDHLRILRFFRFSAAYGQGSLNQEGVAASIRHREKLGLLSRERIRTETLKLFVAPAAVMVLARMDDAGLVSLLLEGTVDPARFARLAAAEDRLGSPPDALLRLAALAPQDRSSAKRLQAALRLSNDEAGRLAGAEDARGRLDPAHPPAEADILALLFACGPRAAADGLMLAIADASGDHEGWTRALELVRSRAQPKLPIGGADVMARGIADGRRVGAVLKLFQANWIRAGFPADPAVLALLLDEAVAAEGRAP